MDIRDLNLWIREAQRKVLMRRGEAYAASLLPHQKQEIIGRETESVKWRIYELDHGEEIEEADRKAQEKRKRDAEQRKQKKKEVKHG